MKSILIALLLTACASVPKPVTVNIPVTVPCVGDLPARPVNTFGTGAYPGDKVAAQAALVDSAAWEGYATKLEVVIAGCRQKAARRDRNGRLGESQDPALSMRRPAGARAEQHVRNPDHPY